MPHPLWILAPGAYAGLSLVAFGAFAWDKRAATRGARRVRERTLLLLVWLGGFAGAWAAMRVAHHKTRKWRFRVAPWAALVLHAAAWIALITRAG
ncbi:MAG: DUF1294 domain-containing protein [Phycisphaerales bacterium]|nr:DUF1294 domain-containing protein [Phycisphaerales bacterium]